MKLEQWQIAYIKWLADQVRDEDSWTEEGLEVAARTTDFRVESAYGFKHGYWHGTKDTTRRLRGK